MHAIRRAKRARQAREGRVYRVGHTDMAESLRRNGPAGCRKMGYGRWQSGEAEVRKVRWESTKQGRGRQPAEDSSEHTQRQRAHGVCVRAACPTMPVLAVSSSLAAVHAGRADRKLAMRAAAGPRCAFLNGGPDCRRFFGDPTNVRTVILLLSVSYTVRTYCGLPAGPRRTPDVASCTTREVVR